MSKSNKSMYVEPEAVRRKLAAVYAKRATESKWTAAERAEFARIAERWAATLPEKIVK